jgi:hypothetical protein
MFIDTFVYDAIQRRRQRNIAGSICRLLGSKWNRDATRRPFEIVYGRKRTSKNMNERNPFAVLLNAVTYLIAQNQPLYVFPPPHLQQAFQILWQAQCAVYLGVDFSSQIAVDLNREVMRRSGARFGKIPHAGRLFRPM